MAVAKHARASLRDWRYPLAATALLVAASLVVSILTMSHYISDSRREAREAKALLAKADADAACRALRSSQLEVWKLRAVADGVENQAAIGDAVALVLSGVRDPELFAAASQRISDTSAVALRTAELAIKAAGERLDSIDNGCAAQAPVLDSLNSGDFPATSTTSTTSTTGQVPGSG